jgi:ammonium transporter, Amt family
MDAGSLAWVLTSSALVLFMTPGLAFFYGGMDRSRNVLNMLMMNFYCLLAVPVLWAIAGYSLSSVPFDNDFIGTFDAFFLNDIGIIDDNGGTIATVAFLGMFAVITPALISGAVADRMKFSAWVAFVPLWLFIVYVPIFKWVFGGWLGQRGSTSPAARRSTSTPVSPPWPLCWSSGSARAGRTRAIRRTRCRW